MEITIGIVLGIGIGWAIWSPYKLYKEEMEYYRKLANDRWESYISLVDKVMEEGTIEGIDTSTHQMD